eukprot:2899176-Pyramimonas_sp.AAC.1
MGVHMNVSLPEAQAKAINSMLDQKIAEIKRTMPTTYPPSSTASSLSGAMRPKPEAMSDPRKVCIGGFPRLLLGRAFAQHGHK